METSFLLLVAIFLIHCIGVHLLRKTQSKYMLLEEGVFVWSSRSPVWVLHLEHAHKGLIIALAVTASMPIWTVFVY